MPGWFERYMADVDVEEDEVEAEVDCIRPWLDC